MYKFLAFLLIIIISPFLGGLYGIIHDQITYTISEEYYTKFKFIQFGLENWGLGENIGTIENPEIKLRNPRFGATIVGTLATWWVGLIIGSFLGIIGLFIHKNGKQMIQTTFIAIFINTGIALFVGFIGLLYGKIFLINNIPSHWFFPKNLLDTNSFIMVSSMHNFSYIGGFIGLIIAIIYSIKQYYKLK
ncbi:hypothetical protein LXD69_13650 [Flavobacterium sediminilitoris]|uniref:Signal peptide-containing protein n=1 Tax=Flavobacterium sediminilitoris TaxID=2024526 RepID=A0ABY4HK64_9FLAO|nr:MULTISPECIES: hypothetical protein [Flavobacterium]UOX33078.1 hypothetical protein LXD69_13650 [Flavobacterium sediminilitoris]